MPSPVDVLTAYFNAGYPVVAVETVEEKRLLKEIKTEKMGEKLYSIAAAGGLIDELKGTIEDASGNFTKSFQFLMKKAESILVVYDFQQMISSATSYRPLIQALDKCKSQGSIIILVAPIWRLPEELKHLCPVLRVDLPTSEELGAPLDEVLKNSSNKSISNRADLLMAARGLTLEEAENVFALASGQDFSRTVVEAEKMRIVRSEYMSVETPRAPDLLAGLGEFKAYLTGEVLPAKQDLDLMVKGVLLVGVPGTGKSLSARVASSLLEWPLVRFDVSAAKGSLVGQSESNMRRALSLADAISPCILWIDEIEKAVGGHASSAATDGGTTLAMIGTLLTWMQEHRTSVMVIATCNDYSKLPPELTRAGRFDEKFFLDLPSIKEREGIATVHLKRLGCDVMFADSIASMTEEWTGAEIEQLVKSAARQTNRKITIEKLDQCRTKIIPISQNNSIKDLRTWATTNLRGANDSTDTGEKHSRKLRS